MCGDTTADVAHHCVNIVVGGRRLLEHALGASRPPFALYVTALGRPRYERLGFVEIDRVTKQIGRPRPAMLESLRRSSPIRDAGPADFEAILGRDRVTFGADRTRLLGRILAGDHHTVIDDRGGFAIRWSNRHLDIVGPIVAGRGSRTSTPADREQHPDPRFTPGAPGASAAPWNLPSE